MLGSLGRAGEGGGACKGLGGGLVVVEGPLVWLDGGGERELGVACRGRGGAGEREAALLGLHGRGAAKGRVGSIVVVVEEWIQNLWR